jgi:hypothetical protein
VRAVRSRKLAFNGIAVIEILILAFVEILGEMYFIEADHLSD